MRNEICRCAVLGCREEIELSDRFDLREKGWGAIPNTSQGLVFEYVCPKHLEALNPILDSLSSLFGLRAGSLGFNALFRARYAAMRPKMEDGTVVFTFQRVAFKRENRRENGEIFSVRGAKTTSNPEDREGRHFTKDEGKEFLRFGPTRSCHVQVASEVEFVYRPPFDGPYMRVGDGREPGRAKQRLDPVERFLVPSWRRPDVQGRGEPCLLWVVPSSSISGEGSMTLRSRTIRLAHENPELRSVLLPLLKEAGGKVPKDLGLVEVRARLGEFLPTFSKEDLRLLQWVGAGNFLFGDLKGGAAVLSPKGKKNGPMDREPESGPRALDLYRRGWLRFAPGPDGNNGYFWPTISGENFLRALGEAKGQALLNGRSAAVLSRAMEVYLKGILESGGSRHTQAIPGTTFKALESRGLVTGGTEVSMLDSGRYGLVKATLTDKGLALATQLWKEEHEQRLRDGLRSERIPKFLANLGIII